MEHNLKIIYDGAHCFGVKYKGKSIFEYGDISTCSFHATKIFHTVEGGCIICNDDELANRMRIIANHGQEKKYYHKVLGCNSRLDTIQAAILNIKLKHLDSYSANRKIIADKYDEAFINLKN